MILEPLCNLECSWRDHGEWASAKAHVDLMLRHQLEKPRERDIPIDKVHYTHDCASDTFIHGAHAGLKIDEVVDELIAGRVKPTDNSMMLDVVFWHGRYWSLNHRHLHADRLFLRQVQPEWKRHDELARVRLWALSSGPLGSNNF